MTRETKTSKCIRCGRLCQLAEQTGEGQPMHKSKTGGCCANCGITCFAKTSPLGDVLGGTDALRLPHVQAQFLAVLKAGGCVEAGAEINWDQVIANWELPLPKGWDWQGELHLWARRRGTR